MIKVNLSLRDYTTLVEKLNTETFKVRFFKKFLNDIPLDKIKDYYVIFPLEYEEKFSYREDWMKFTEYLENDNIVALKPNNMSIFNL